MLIYVKIFHVAVFCVVYQTRILYVNFSQHVFQWNIILKCMYLFQNCVARALYDNIAESPDELAFRKGDTLTVLEQNTGGIEGWWLCSLRGRQVRRLLVYFCCPESSSCFALSLFSSRLSHSPPPFYIYRPHSRLLTSCVRTTYGSDDQGFETGQGQEILFSSIWARPALEPTRLPITVGTGVLSR